MLDSELIGYWEDGGHPGLSGSPGGDSIIFFPDGTGRYEFINWVLCSAEIFQWETIRPGILRIMGKNGLEVCDLTKTIIETTTIIEEMEISYNFTITTRFGKLLRVLHLSLDMPFSDCFGFGTFDLTEHKEPNFSFLLNS